MTTRQPEAAHFIAQIIPRYKSAATPEERQEAFEALAEWVSSEVPDGLGFEKESRECGRLARKELRAHGINHRPLLEIERQLNERRRQGFPPA